MAKFSEMSKGAQVGGIVVIAVLISLALYIGFFKTIDDQNRLDRQKLEARRAEVQDLRKYEANLPQLNRQIEALKQQLEIQKRIVPDEKEADQFMHLLQNTAQSSGIEIRRWTAKQVSTREYYTEVPFDLELDGPYYSVLTFFDKVSKLERIINVSNLQLSNLKDGKFKHGYQYAPQESVAGVCTAIAFFSHDPVMVPGSKSGMAPGGKPGTKPPVAK